MREEELERGDPPSIGEAVVTVGLGFHHCGGAVNEEYLSPDDAGVWVEGDELLDGYQVIALDPGGTTGWALFQVHPMAMEGDPGIPVLSNIEWWTAGEFTGKQEDQIDEIIELVESWPNARLVTEQFILRQLNAELSPAEINATLRWATRPRYWIPQQPALAMSAVTDARQKAWGFWVPGKPHARDGVKHAITFLKRQKERAVKAALAAARSAARSA
jgi:hypothetical protein